MGNTQGIPQPHLRMYQNLLAIQSPKTRLQMIQTMLSSPEHESMAREVGVYGILLHYVQQVKNGAAPPVLPGEKREQTLVTHSSSSVTGGSAAASAASAASQKGNERAMNYFSACLRILGLQEEVALTEETLKSSYKKAVIRAHPDKGGSEKEFEAVTRAYAYLGEILKRIHGGRGKEGVVESPTKLASGRTNEADAWKMVEPIRLNPDKLDLSTFNSMFEKTRIPDPEETGYGDWLKGSEEKGQVKFSGKFNREVFHKAFEDEQSSRGIRQNNTALVAQELNLSSRYATEIGRTGRDDYTVAANDGGLQYTDLKKAYTEYNTFSQQTAGVRVDSRTLSQYSAERDSAPKPLANHELEAVTAMEASMKRAEEQRKMRLAQEAVEGNSYFERMKRLVIRN